MSQVIHCYAGTVNGLSNISYCFNRMPEDNVVNFTEDESVIDLMSKIQIRKLKLALHHCIMQWENATALENSAAFANVKDGCVCCDLHQVDKDCYYIKFDLVIDIACEVPAYIREAVNEAVEKYPEE